MFAAPRLAVVCAICALSPAALAGKVLVVDGASPAAYATIQGALNASQDGDVVLVRAGNYPAFVIDARAVAVVADAGAQVQVQGTIEVRNTSANQSVILAGLTSIGAVSDPETQSFGLYCQGNAGALRVERCGFRGRVDTSECCAASCPSSTCNVGVKAEYTSDLSFARCEMVGGQRARASSSIQYAGHGGAGLYLRYSAAALFDSSVAGGDGMPGITCSYLWCGGFGADAATAVQSALLTGHSSFRGGRGGRAGGSGSFWNPPWGGDGGDGIDLWYSSSAHVLDSASWGGPGGPASSATYCGDYTYSGDTGLARRGTPFHDVAGGGRRMICTTPLRESKDATIVFHGRPGDTVGVLSSTIPAPPQYDPSWGGCLVVPSYAPITTFALGVLPANGRLDARLPLPTLPAGEQLEIRYLQSVFVDRQGGRHVATPCSLVILDEAF